MSGVLAVNRNVSKMLVYQNAINIRTELTKWILKDFGLNRKTKRLSTNIKDMSEEDANIIDEIINKYDVNNDKWYISTYPKWFSESEKVYLLNITRDIMADIVKANNIYVTEFFEYEDRRRFINLAISNCYILQQELDYITTIFPSNLNFIIDILEKVKTEIELLKAWRKHVKKPQ